MAKPSPPCAIAVTLGLAAERIKGALGIEVELGVNDTPRRTSPATAVRKVVKVSAAAPEAVVLASVSVMDTSLLGSAPWSPLALTVEVTAKTVTVPLEFTMPVILRRPSVAGLIAAG